MNEGALEAARAPVQTLENVQHPLAKVVAARFYFHFDEIEKARNLLADALFLLGERDDPVSAYIREYAKVFLVDFPDQRWVKEQIGIALALQPDDQLFGMLPLYDDLDCLS